MGVSLGVGETDGPDVLGASEGAAVHGSVGCSQHEREQFPADSEQQK